MSSAQTSSKMEEEKLKKEGKLYKVNLLVFLKYPSKSEHLQNLRLMLLLSLTRQSLVTDLDSRITLASQQLGEGLEKDVRSKLFCEYYFHGNTTDGTKIKVREDAWVYSLSIFPSHITNFHKLRVCLILVCRLRSVPEMHTTKLLGFRWR